MPRTMPSGAERVQPMPLTRIIILLLFFFILVNLGIIWGGRVGKSEARRETRGPAATAAAGRHRRPRSRPQPAARPGALLPAPFLFFKISYFLFYSRARFPRRTLGATPSVSPGLRQGRAKLAAPGGVRARRGARDPTR